MPSLKRLVATLVLLLTLSHGGSAQNGMALPHFDRPVPSNARILQMGYTNLNAWAYAHAPSMSEAQADAVAFWYATIRENENRRIFPNPTLRAATSALRQWASARWYLMSLQAGGGSMYMHAAYRSAAVIADVEAAAIRGWTAPGKPNAARDVCSFRAMYPNGKVPSGTSTATFKKAQDEEARWLDRLKAALRRIPPEPQRLYADYMISLIKERFE